MRVLVASTGGAGHLNPLVPFIDALARRGDEVLIAVPPELKTTIEAMGRPFRIGKAPPNKELEPIWHRVPIVSPREAAVLVNREIFGRLCTAAMLSTVQEACADWRPDLVLREPCEYSSAIVANRLGIPHAQVGISRGDVEAASLALAARHLRSYGDDIVKRIRAVPYLTRFPAALDPAVFADTRRFSEAAAAPGEPLPEWWDASHAPLVYVSFGSIAGGLPIGQPAYRAALDAVDGLDARVLLTVGHSTNVAELGPIPRNVHVERGFRRCCPADRGGRGVPRRIRNHVRRAGGRRAPGHGSLVGRPALECPCRRRFGRRRDGDAGGRWKRKDASAGARRRAPHTRRDQGSAW